MNTSIFQFLTYISSFLVVLYVLFRKSRARAVPPGPPGLPLLGNLFQIRKDAWLTFTEWKETYGTIPPLQFICFDLMLSIPRLSSVYHYSTEGDSDTEQS